MASKSDGLGGLIGPHLSRRNFIIAATAGGMTLAELVDALGGEPGDLFAGVAALNQAFNVAGDLYVGPDSARSTVNADSGRVYLASDTETMYYGDSGSWVSLGQIGAGALTDSGAASPGGGDAYQLPQAADSIDLQNQGAIEDASEISTEQGVIAEANRGIDAKAWMDQDPQGSGLSDIAEAANDAFSYLQSNYRDGLVVIPPPSNRDADGWIINSQLLIPDESAAGSGTTSVGSFTLRGHGKRSTLISPGASFPGGTYLVAIATGSFENHGYEVSDLALVDKDAEVSTGGLLWDSTKTGSINRCHFEMQSADPQLRINSTSLKNAVRDCTFLNFPGTGLEVELSGGYLKLDNVTAKGDAGSTCLHVISGERVMGEFDPESGEVGMRLAGRGADLRGRFEGAFGSGANLEVPVWFEGPFNTVKADSKSDTGSGPFGPNVRNEGAGNRLETPTRTTVTRLNTLIGGLDSSEIFSTGDGSLALANQGTIAVQSGSTSGNRVVAETAGNQSIFATSAPWSNIIGQPRSTLDAIYEIRFAFVDSNNYCAITFDSSSDTNWQLEAYSGGSAVGSTPIDTGVSVTANRDYLFSGGLSYNLANDDEYWFAAVYSYDDQGHDGIQFGNGPGESGFDPVRVEVETATGSQKSMWLKKWETRITL